MYNLKDKNKAHILFQNILNCSDRNESIQKIYNEYGKLIYQISFSIIKNKEEAEDITHNIFEKLIEISYLKLPSDNELTWIYSVTKNETINYIKSKKKSINIEEIYNISDDNNFIDEVLDKNVYNKLINKLNKKEKEVVSLKVLGDLSFKEISLLLNVPIGTIQYRYYKGINSLKALITNFSLLCISTILYILNRYNAKKVIDSESEIMNDEETQNIVESEENKSDSEKIKQDEENELNNDNTQTSEIIQIPVESQHYLNHDICNNILFSLSIILMFVTIISLIIFQKYQQKLKLKLSK